MKRMSDQFSSNDSGVGGKSPPAEKMPKSGDGVGNETGASIANIENSGGEKIQPTSISDSNGVPPAKTNLTTGIENVNQEICPSVSVNGDDEIASANIAGASASETAMDEKVSFVVMFGKAKYNVDESLSETVADLKEKIAKLSGVPPSMQKLTYKGMLKDGQTLREAKITDGCKIMLIGSTPTQVAAANTAPKPEELSKEEAQASAKEPLCKQKQHAKVLEKGIPDDAMPGIKNARDGLPVAPISGMINSRGHKVRLTFKLELDQVWLGTKERTEKIMMSQIKDVVSEPIHGHEEYHIMGLQLGPTEASRYWLYWVPAQYVAAIKEAIIG